MDNQRVFGVAAVVIGAVILFRLASNSGESTPPDDDNDNNPPPPDDDDNNPPPPDPTPPDIDQVLEGVFNHMIVIPPGEVWQVKNVELQAVSLVVEGVMYMEPGDQLRFTGTFNQNITGGGVHNPDTDIGVWVVGNGTVDILGTRKVAWHYLGDDPSWSASDELYAASVTPLDGSINATRFIKGSIVPFQPDGTPAEIANITRDIKITGNPGGYIHFHIHSSQPPINLSWVEIAYSGVPKIDHKGNNIGVPGRFGLHFHQMRNVTRGVTIEGLVVRDGRNAAYWPHGSDGITFRDCIAFRQEGRGFGWNHGKAANDQSHDISYDGCLVLDGRSFPDFRHLGLGFELDEGQNNQVINSVVAGCNGAGFSWPFGLDAVWGFPAVGMNRSHHTNGGDVFVWQNHGNNPIHDVPIDSIASQVGILAGAYETPAYHYGSPDGQPRSSIRFCSVGIEQHAQGGDAAIQHKRPDGYTTSFENIDISDCNTGVRHEHHNRNFDLPILFKNLTFTRCNRKVVVDDNPAGRTDSWRKGRFDYVNCGLSPQDIVILSATPGMILRIQEGNIAWSVNRQGTVTPIAPFYPLS